MEKSSKEWLVPLTGVAFIVVGLISFVVGGTPKDAKHPVNEIVDWYVDNKDSVEVGAFLSAVAAALLIFYGAYLRKVLVAAEGAGAMLPILSLIGVSIVAVGFAIDATISFSIAEAADDIEPASVQTLQALWDNDFVPILLGSMVLLWSAGISVLRSGALPRWLGWAAIAFGVMTLAGPISFVGAIGAALWVLVSSIVMSIQARSAT